MADLRARVAKLFSYVEDLMYVGLAALLALSALVLLGASAVSLWDSIAQGGRSPAASWGCSSSSFSS